MRMVGPVAPESSLVSPALSVVVSGPVGTVSDVAPLVSMAVSAALPCAPVPAVWTVEVGRGARPGATRLQGAPALALGPPPLAWAEAAPAARSAVRAAAS